MGNVVRSIGKVFSGAVSGFLGGGPIGAILGGVGGAMGKGGIGSLLNPMKLFGNLAKNVLGKLGNLGLGGLSRPPSQMGRVGMAYPRPGIGQAGGCGPSGGVGGNLGGPGLSATENKLIGSFGRLEGQQKALMDKLNDPNLSQAEIAKIQQQLQKIKQMMEMITKAMGEMNKVVSSIIQNIRA